MPEPYEPIELEYNEVADEDLDALRAEGSSKYLPDVTVRLLVEMLKVVNDPTDPTTAQDIDGLLQEVRDFLLAESQLSSVLQLVDKIEEIVSDTDNRTDLIRSFTSERAIRKIITSLPKAITSPPPELLHILDISPINHLPVLIQILNVERRPSSRSVLRGLLGKYIEEQADQVIDSLDRFEDAIALDLIDALVTQNKEYSQEIIWAMKDTSSPPILHKILNMLIEDGVSYKYKDWLLNLLATTTVVGVRAKVLELTRTIAERELFIILNVLKHS